MQALLKVQRLEDKIGDYMLVEDVQSGWEKKDQEKASTQRILDITEKVLQAQNKWKGAGRFILRKLSDVCMMSCIFSNKTGRTRAMQMFRYVNVNIKGQ